MKSIRVRTNKRILELELITPLYSQGIRITCCLYDSPFFYFQIPNSIQTFLCLILCVKLQFNGKNRAQNNAQQRDCTLWKSDQLCVDQRAFQIKGKQGYAIQRNYYYLDWDSIVDWRRSRRMKEQRKIVMIMTPSKGETKPKQYKFKRINFIVSYFVFAADRFIFHPKVSTICSICKKK